MEYGYQQHFEAGVRKRKLALFNKDPHCHWCGCLTTIDHPANIKGHPPKNMATVDHLVSRYNLSRWEKPPTNEERTVLACFECNQKRGIEETKQLSIEEIRARGRGFKFKPYGLTVNPPTPLSNLIPLDNITITSQPT